MNNLIAICGPIGSGKDTASNYLVEKHGFTKLSFGGLVKDIVSILFSWNRELLEGDTLESREWRETVDEWWSSELQIFNFTPRMALTMIATDALRNHFHPDIWVKALKRKIMEYEKVVISDCRFLNEAEFIRSMNGKIIKIFREYPSSGQNLHQSETEWIKIDADLIIHNNQNIENIFQKIQNIF